MHPWFRCGMPPDLDLNAYNEHYLCVSREAGGAVDAIQTVLSAAAVAEPAPALMPAVRTHLGP